MGQDTNGGGSQRTAAPRWRPGHEAGSDTARIEAFSDAVIAIMLTLLAIELLQFDPTLAREIGLLGALKQKWPSYFAFLLTFLVIGQIWVTHHNLWRYVARVDQGISIINLLLLGFVAVTPFGAQILAESFVALPQEQACVGAALYSSIMLGQATAFNLLLWWAHRHCLLDEGVHEDLYRAIARRFLFGPALYAVALLLSFIDPQVGLTCYVGVILLYFFPGAGDLPTGREQARAALGG